MPRRPTSTNKGSNFSGPMLQKLEELKLPKFESISGPGAKQSHSKPVKYKIRLLDYFTQFSGMPSIFCII